MFGLKIGESTIVTSEYMYLLLIAKTCGFNVKPSSAKIERKTVNAFDLYKGTVYIGKLIDYGRDKYVLVEEDKTSQPMSKPGMQSYLKELRRV